MKRPLDGKGEPPMTEPVIRECLFITGGAVEVAEGTVRLIFWVEAPNMGGEMRERRIVARLAMGKRTARNVYGSLEDMLDD